MFEISYIVVHLILKYDELMKENEMNDFLMFLQQMVTIYD